MRSDTGSAVGQPHAFEISLAGRALIARRRRVSRPPRSAARQGHSWVRSARQSARGASTGSDTPMTLPFCSRQWSEEGSVSHDQRKQLSVCSSKCTATRRSPCVPTPVYKLSGLQGQRKGSTAERCLSSASLASGAPCSGICSPRDGQDVGIAAQASPSDPTLFGHCASDPPQADPESRSSASGRRRAVRRSRPRRER